MIRTPIDKRWRIALALASLVALLAAYSFMSHRQKERNPDDTTIPSWTQLKDGVARFIAPHSRTGERWILVDSLATGYRFLIGMTYGVVSAIAIGLLMGCFPLVESVLSPPLTLFAKVPGTAALAVFFVLFDAGSTSMFVAMITFGIVPSLAVSIHLAVRDVPDELLHKAYTLGASHAEVIWNVIVRYILPKLIDAIRLQIGPAMVYLIAAELLVSDAGFGYRIRLLMKRADMSVVFPYLALLAAFGFLMDFSLLKAQRFLCPWHSPVKR